MYSVPFFISSLLLLSFVFLKLKSCWELYRIIRLLRVWLFQVFGVFIWAVYEQQVICVAIVGYIHTHLKVGSLMTSPVCPTWGPIFRL